MAEEIAAGAVVGLKSGGPTMTVSEVLVEDGIAECVWFDNDVLSREQFPLSGLKVIPEKEIPPYRPRR